MQYLLAVGVEQLEYRNGSGLVSDVFSISRSVCSACYFSPRYLLRAVKAIRIV